MMNKKEYKNEKKVYDVNRKVIRNIYIHIEKRQFYLPHSVINKYICMYVCMNNRTI